MSDTMQTTTTTSGPPRQAPPLVQPDRPLLTTDRPTNDGEILNDVDDLALMPVDALVEYFDSLTVAQARAAFSSFERAIEAHRERAGIIEANLSTVREHLHQAGNYASRGPVTASRS